MDLVPVLLFWSLSGVGFLLVLVVFLTCFLYLWALMQCAYGALRVARFLLGWLF